MEEDINIFVPEDKFLQIGKKRFKIWVSAERSLKATVMFNKLAEKGSEENEAIKTDYDMFSVWVDICLILIKQDLRIMMKKSFSIKTIIDVRRRKKLTKKHLMDTMDIKELKSFVDDALEPIIGTKKKEMEREQKTADAMLLIMDAITPEELAKLLQNSLLGVDIPKVM